MSNEEIEALGTPEYDEKRKKCDKYEKMSHNMFNYDISASSGENIEALDFMTSEISEFVSNVSDKVSGFMDMFRN